MIASKGDGITTAEGNTQVAGSYNADKTPPTEVIDKVEVAENIRDNNVNLKDMDLYPSIEELESPYVQANTAAKDHVITSIQEDSVVSPNSVTLQTSNQFSSLLDEVVVPDTQVQALKEINMVKEILA